MKKNPHIIWVCPDSQSFFRSKGEVKCRPSSVVPKLVEKGFRVNILIPYDSSLLPKTKLSTGRVTRPTIKLGQDYTVELVKLTRGNVVPGIYMAKLPSVETPVSKALYSRAALALAEQINRPVDIFHVFGWETALVSMFLEIHRTENSRLFKNSRAFLNVSNLNQQGNFSPALLKALSIPQELFHPEGIEFFGKISYLKAGLIFSDGIGLIENGKVSKQKKQRNDLGWDGVLDSMGHKLRRWASERSLKSYLDAYDELLTLKKTGSLLPHLLKKLHKSQDEFDKFLQSWGPLPPDKYNTRSISFLFQSPTKAYGFWEWSGAGLKDFGLILEDATQASRSILSRSLAATGDFWLDVKPGREYIIELVGWDENKKMIPLLRSQRLKIPRSEVSGNKNAIFVDVKSRQRYTVTGAQKVSTKRTFSGGTSAWEWALSDLGHSVKSGRSS
jgi:hypothetical protein